METSPYKKRVPPGSPGYLSDSADFGTSIDSYQGAGSYLGFGQRARGFSDAGSTNLRFATPLLTDAEKPSDEDTDEQDRTWSPQQLPSPIVVTNKGGRVGRYKALGGKGYTSPGRRNGVPATDYLGGPRRVDTSKRFMYVLMCFVGIA